MAPSGRGLLKPWQLSGVKRTRPPSNGAAAFDPSATLAVRSAKAIQWRTAGGRQRHGPTPSKWGTIALATTSSVKYQRQEFGDDQLDAAKQRLP
jgi:hypothetical protein